MVDATLVEAVKQYAHDHYNDLGKGWDYIVETYTDDELAELVEGARTPLGAIKKAAAVAKILAERRADIQATAF